MIETVLKSLPNGCRLVRSENTASDGLDSFGDWVAAIFSGGASVVYVATNESTNWRCSSARFTSLGVGRWGIEGDGKNITGNEQLTYDGLRVFLKARDWSSWEPIPFKYLPLIKPSVDAFPAVVSTFREENSATIMLAAYTKLNWTDLVIRYGQIFAAMAAVVGQQYKVAAGLALNVGKQIAAELGQNAKNSRSMEEFYANGREKMDKLFSEGPIAILGSGLFENVPLFQQQLETYYKVQVHGPHQPMLRQFCSAFPGSCDVLRYGTNNAQSMLMLKQNVTYEQAYAQTDQVARDCQRNPTDPACVQWNFTAASSVDAIERVEHLKRLDLAKKVGVGVGAAALVLFLMNVLRKD